MRLPDVLSAEERSRRWWKAWRTVDFSWAALANKAWSGADGAAGDDRLQDYWRLDPASGARRSDSELFAAGELERDPRGRPWHVAHLPAQWDDGSPTWKSDLNDPKWQDFWRIVRARLDASGVDALTGGPADESPAPAALAGVVFGEAPPDWAWDENLLSLNAAFQTCAFLAGVSFSGVESASDLDLRHCLFGSIADFDRVLIHGDLELDAAVFLSHLRMARATIAGDLRISDCDFRGELSFHKGRVEGETRCYASVFHAPALFEESSFVSEASFAWCRFLSVASFVDLRFRGLASFVDDVFATDTTFAGRCYGDFHCVDCTFERGTTFAFMFFRREAWFAASRFGEAVLLQNLRFRGKASFLDAVFHGELRCVEVCFGGAVAFHNVVFEGMANLSGCRFPADSALHHAAFRGADFRRTADFTLAGFTPWGAFTETAFQQDVLFSPQALRDRKSFAAAFTAAGEAAAAAAKGDPERYALEVDRRFGELEKAFQALKKGMARQQARLEEHRFYRLELLARRRCSAASFLERCIIGLYDVSSRCGTSYVRPLVILAALVLLCGLGFWLSTQTADSLAIALAPLPMRGPDGAFVDAVRFSLENTIQPMSVWKNVPASAHPRAAWVQALLNEDDPIRFLLVRVAATLQSLVSIALLFLAALGFKRHFQMST